MLRGVCERTKGVVGPAQQVRNPKLVRKAIREGQARALRREQKRFFWETGVLLLKTRS